MRVTVLADETTGLGLRLAGATVASPADTALVQSFESALAAADLVLVSAPLAARLPPRLLAQAQERAEPLVLVIADVAHGTPPPDVPARARRALGVA